MPSPSHNSFWASSCLVTAYGIAAVLGAKPDIVQGLPNGAALGPLGGGFALWASVSEGRATRSESTRDLVLLSMAAALFIVTLNATIGLTESAWAITACTYAIAGSQSATIDRVKRRILGTAIGVPLGLVCLPLVASAPLIVWAAAALAMVIYAMAPPRALRNRLWCVRLHADRHPRSQWRSFGPTACLTRLGNSPRRDARSGCRDSPFAASHLKAVATGKDSDLQPGNRYRLVLFNVRVGEAPVG